MAQTGYTPIKIYSSTTPAATPSAGNLDNTNGAELAINIADGKLFYKDSSNVVQVIASKAGSLGDVVGPASSTDNAIVRFDGTTGKLIQNSAVTVADTTGDITGGKYNKITITAPATGATLTIADGKTATFNNSITVAGVDGKSATFNNNLTFAGVDGKTVTLNNSLTFAGTDATTMTFPSTSQTIAGLANAQTFTALQTFAGTSSVLASKFINALEAVTVSATAATGTIDYDATTQSVLYYTSNAIANWTVNFRASSGTSLDSAMSTGESITVAFLVTQGATPYYNNAVQVDGNAITPKWQGGAAPTSGNANSIDAYVYTVVKTGAATFTVFASQTQFA